MWWLVSLINKFTKQRVDRGWVDVPQRIWSRGEACLLPPADWWICEKCKQCQDRGLPRFIAVEAPALYSSLQRNIACEINFKRSMYQAALFESIAFKHGQMKANRLLPWLLEWSCKVKRSGISIPLLCAARFARLGRRSMHCSREECDPMPVVGLATTWEYSWDGGRQAITWFMAGRRPV